MTFEKGQRVVESNYQGALARGRPIYRHGIIEECYPGKRAFYVTIRWDFPHEAVLYRCSKQYHST